MDALSERDYATYRDSQVEVTDPITKDQLVEGRVREFDAALEEVRQELTPYIDMAEARSRFGLDVPTFEETFEAIFDETYDLLIERQRKYGPKNIEQQGVFGILTRIKDDKLSRIMRALNGRVVNGQIVLDAIDLSGEEGDTLEDALKDVANYALIALALIRGVWGRPLEEEMA